MFLPWSPFMLVSSYTHHPTHLYLHYLSLMAVFLHAVSGTLLLVQACKDVPSYGGRIVDQVVTMQQVVLLHSPVERGVGREQSFDGLERAASCLRVHCL